MWDFHLTPFSNNMRYSPRSAMAALENFFIGGFEKAIGHFVAVAVTLGQIPEAVCGDETVHCLCRDSKDKWCNYVHVA